MDELTWTCHFCGKERPDSKISAMTTERVLGVGIPIKLSRRYCNDNKKCISAAEYWRKNCDKYGNIVK